MDPQFHKIIRLLLSAIKEATVSYSPTDKNVIFSFKLSIERKVYDELIGDFYKHVDRSES